MEPVTLILCLSLFDENIASGNRLVSRYRETAGRLIFDRRSRTWREHKPTVDYLGDVLRQMRKDPRMTPLYPRIDAALDDYFWTEVQ